jgi:predicted flavoprotein YhiN
MKASGLLRHWLSRLDQAGVTFELRHRWLGFDGARLRFDGETPSVAARATVLALGGAAGRSSDPMRAGRPSSERVASRSGRFSRPIAASKSPGRSTSANAPRAGH